MAKATKEKAAPEWGSEQGKWGAEMAKLPGALQDWNDPHEQCIRITRSPSVGFAFANGYGLPCGYTLMWYGVQKGGKSLGCYDTVGALHEDSPTAEAAYYSTEYRIKLQLTPSRARMHGIDPKRLHRYQTNKPEGIFDVIEKDIDEKCRRGMDLKLIVIDSASQIQGRQAANKESVLDFTIGDHAQTMQIGLQRILPVIRDRNIALILIVHVRSEMDQQILQREGKKRGGSIKPQASWATKHFAEYFMYSERDDTKAGREGMTNPELGDMNRNNSEGEITGSRMRCLMKENSCGPRGRMGLYTFDSNRGIINVHEEVFELCKNRNVIETAGSTYKYDGKSWRGKDALLEELAANPSFQKELMTELRRRDNAGMWTRDEVSEMDKRVAGLTDVELDIRQSHELEQ